MQYPGCHLAALLVSAPLLPVATLHNLCHRIFLLFVSSASAQLQTNKMSMVRIASVSVFNCWFSAARDGRIISISTERAREPHLYLSRHFLFNSAGEVMLFVICDETTGPKYLVWEVSRHQILCGEKFKVNTSAELHCVTIAISGSHCHNNTTKYLHTQQFYKYLNNFDKKQVKKSPNQ